MQKFQLTESDDSFKIRDVKVVAAEPEDSDLRRLEHLRREKESGLEAVVFLVKIYISGIPVSGTGMSLYVGEELIPRYWAFDGGIYFIVYEPSFFAKHRDDLVGTSFDGGVTVEPSGFVIPEPQSAPETMAFNLLAANEASHITLPSKQAALAD